MILLLIVLIKLFLQLTAEENEFVSSEMYGTNPKQAAMTHVQHIFKFSAKDKIIQGDFTQ